MKAKLFNTRLFFLITPAMIGLVLFASFVINDNLHKQANTEKINALIKLSIINNKLVHELQKERGMSRGAISTPNNNFTEKLNQQRALTDVIIEKRRRFLPENIASIENKTISQTLQKVDSELAKIAKFRQQVDQNTITSQTLINYYTTINAKLINIVLPTIKLANKDTITNLLQTYYNLIQAKELAGLERALVSAVLNSGQISVEQKNRYTSLVAIQSAYLKTFNLLASSPLLSFYNNAMEHPSIAEVIALRKAILSDSPNASLSNLTPSAVQWFDIATLRINQLALVEDEIVTQLQQATYQQSKKAESILTFSIIYSLLAIGLTLALLYQLMKSHRVQKIQQEQLHKFGLVIENTPTSVLITNADGVIEYTNKSFTNMTGYEANEVIGQKPRMWKSEHTAEETYQEINASINSNKPWQGELLNIKKDSSPYWARTKIFPVMSKAGKVIQIIGLQEDVTKQKATQEKIKYLANYDELTGLPSLRLGKDRLKQAILSAQRHKLDMAVLFVDLDGFKKVNDQYGHAAGDSVLKEVSERMVSILRSTDTVARIGGDEFMVILTNLKSLNAVNKVSAKMIELISAPFNINTNTMNIGASIGIATSPSDGYSSSELIKKADKAMYYVKHSGKNDFLFYNDMPKESH